jgi:hypothetical protein
VITGLEVIALQALEQFVLYTGVRPTDEQVAAAVAFAQVAELAGRRCRRRLPQDCAG